MTCGAARKFVYLSNEERLGGPPSSAEVAQATAHLASCAACQEFFDSEKRLRALPFAVRCKDCEEARENAQQRERQLASRRGTASLFLDM